MNEQSLAPLKKALGSLKLAIGQPLNEFTRDSVIQRFEYTFELSWKNLKRFLESNAPLSDDSVKGILREAHQLKLITHIDQWFSFHKSRNLTSHTYNADTAEEVYRDAIQLPALCDEMISELEKKLKA
ncbi:MAG: nucleotidyltransferase substrate binding protein [Cryobacterium sp.]|nr:nucleotidyltransferase substrate binding protein [Oligoflexia bacterium]